MQTKKNLMQQLRRDLVQLTVWLHTEQILTNVWKTMLREDVLRNSMKQKAAFRLHLHR